MATVTIGRAKHVLSEAYSTMAELAVTDIHNPPVADRVPRKPEYWVGRLETDLFAVAELLQVLLNDAEKNARQ